jgi:hypothetical protein
MAPLVPVSLSQRAGHSNVSQRPNDPRCARGAFSSNRRGHRDPGWGVLASTYFGCKLGRELMEYNEPLLGEHHPVVRPEPEAPEQKSLSEAADMFGCAGVKIRQLEALRRRRQRAGDEAGGTLCESPLRGSD